MNERKQQFIKALAQFLSGNIAAKSISLQIKPLPEPLPQWPKEWAALRGTLPLNGWLSVEETEKALQEFLG